MKKHLMVFLTFILMACAAPAAETSPTEGAAPLATVIAIPPTETAEPQTFFKVFGDAPIVSKGEAGTWDDRYTDPGAVVFHDGIFHMFRNGFRGFPAESQVGYVTSVDGYTWEKQGSDPVFLTKDVPYAQVAMFVSSALVEDDGTWVLYFYTLDSVNFPFSGVIGRATAASPNGPWIPDAEPVLMPGSAREWDSRNVAAPHVIKTADGYVMYYSGTDSTGKVQVGMAASSDGVQWAKYNDPATTEIQYQESDPVLLLGEKSSWESDQVHQARVFPDGDGWVMIYRGSNKNQASMGLGIATSRDGIHWVKSALNPVLLPTEIKGAYQFWFHNALFVNGTYFVFIEGDINQRTQIYLATREGEMP